MDRSGADTTKPKPHVLVLSPLFAEQMDLLERHFMLHRMDMAADRDAFLDAVGHRCEGMLSNARSIVDSALLSGLPELRIVSCCAVGFDNHDVPALTERGIRLTNTPDVLTDDVADMAILLMLAARRKLLDGDRHVRSGEWARSGPMPLTRRTRGSRLGIVGFGRIGQAIAHRGAALGQEIGYCARSVKTGVPFTSFRSPLALAEWADILIAAVPGSRENKGLISAEVLHALGPDGTFVNVARGLVVDEDAMIEALQSSRLGAAGLDVYRNEPSPDPRLLECGTTVFYPHHASGTVETRQEMHQLAADNLLAFFGGHLLLTPIN